MELSKATWFYPDNLLPVRLDDLVELHPQGRPCPSRILAEVRALVAPRLASVTLQVRAIIAAQAKGTT